MQQVIYGQMSAIHVLRAWQESCSDSSARSLAFRLGARCDNASYQITFDSASKVHSAGIYVLDGPGEIGRDGQFLR